MAEFPPAPIPRLRSFTFIPTPSLHLGAGQIDDENNTRDDAQNDLNLEQDAAALDEAERGTYSRRKLGGPRRKRRIVDLTPVLEATGPDHLLPPRTGRVKQHFANYNTPLREESPQRPPEPSSLPQPAKEDTKEDRTHRRPETEELVPQIGIEDEVSATKTCSLNLVCYRFGTQGCQMRQIQTINRSRFDDIGYFKEALAENPDLISTDVEFLEALRREYFGPMCGFWRRTFSLKTLRGFRLLQVRRRPIFGNTCYFSSFINLSYTLLLN